MWRGRSKMRKEAGAKCTEAEAKCGGARAKCGEREDQNVEKGNAERGWSETHTVARAKCGEARAKCREARAKCKEAGSKCGERQEQDAKRCSSKMHREAGAK